MNHRHPTPPYSDFYTTANRLVETDRLAHGGLDVEGLDVLPVLLEERDKEVDREHDVRENLVIVHVDMANGDTQAENLLELELDGGADLSELVAQVLAVRDGGGELAGWREGKQMQALMKMRRTLGETGTKETGDLLDESLRGEESVVLLGELLDKLLVLVEPDASQHSASGRYESQYALLEVVNGHVLELYLLCTIDIVGIGENADGHPGTGNVGEPAKRI